MRAPIVLALAALVAACRQAPRSATPPRGEFLVATDDSTFWVTSGPSGVRARGLPIQLARFDGRFYEVYAMDDDRSYADATLVGQRLYRRDLETRDSALVFADTMVPRVAREYARDNPDERPLAPDEDGSDDPGTVATAEIDILDVHGPYLSFQYATDLQVDGGDARHSVRQGVIDLRAGGPVGLRQLFGQAAARQLVAEGRGSYGVIADSVRLASGSEGRRAARALRHYRFDETSFALTDVDGAPAVTFVVPASLVASDIDPLPLPPIRAGDVRWWRDVRATLPADDDGRVARWHHEGFDVMAVSDTTDSIAQLLLADPAGRRWSVANLSSPPQRIFWIDTPALTTAQRRALEGAFEEASLYDEDARSVARHAPLRRPAIRSTRLVRRATPRIVRRAALLLPVRRLPATLRAQ